MAYSTAADLYSRFGRKNVRQWADLDNEQVDADIDARIAWAIGQADAEIDARFRQSTRYFVPLESLDDEGTPSILTEVATAIAGVKLYEGRGIQDYDPNTGQPIHRLHWHRKWAHDTIQEIIRGSIKLNYLLRDDFKASAPTVVTDEETTEVTGFETTSE